jgi:hypothetical protein
MVKIGTVISYCTLDYKFIKFCIDAVKPFSSQTVLVVADHFFDGTPEDRELLSRTHSDLQGTDIIEYKWQDNSPRYWHNMSRWIGLQSLQSDIDFILFLDADEIVDKKFNEWLRRNESLFVRYDGFLFLCYWYFREARYRATTWEKACILARKDMLRKDSMFTEAERDGIVFSLLPNVTVVSGTDGTPMVHHYSWVRTKEQMLKKVRCWGHRDDLDWERLVEKEFSHDFSGTDFLPGHHYEYETVQPVHNIKL